MGAGFGYLFLPPKGSVDGRSYVKSVSDPLFQAESSLPTYPTSKKGGVAYGKFMKGTSMAVLQEETARRVAWETNFPWKATTDPSVVFDPGRHRADYAHPVTTNHGFLKGFFENEARFSPQFEQLYYILKDYDRADNPVVVGEVFQTLWDYHQAAKLDPESLWIEGNGSGEPVINRQTGEPITMEEETRTLKDGIIYHVHAERSWPDKATLTAEEAEALRDRIVAEIQGMDALSDPRFFRMGDYEDALQAGESPLVPKVGWQAAYDEWDKVSELDLQMRIQQGDSTLKQHFPELFDAAEASPQIGPNNELLDQSGQPLLLQERSGFFGSLVTPEGERVPLREGEDGRVYLPTPMEIEAMRSRGEWTQMEE